MMPLLLFLLLLLVFFFSPFFHGLLPVLLLLLLVRPNFFKNADCANVRLAAFGARAFTFFPDSADNARLRSSGGTCTRFFVFAVESTNRLGVAISPHSLS